MIKIITYIIQKMEWHISKKEHKIHCKDNPSKRLKLYRDLLDRIDEYKHQDNTLLIRHYRYFTFNVSSVLGEEE